eukprot:scaffold168722_cov48-Attheya_sp.AAC.2
MGSWRTDLSITRRDRSGNQIRVQEEIGGAVVGSQCLDSVGSSIETPSGCKLRYSVSACALEERTRGRGSWGGYPFSCGQGILLRWAWELRLYAWKHHNPEYINSRLINNV